MAVGRESAAGHAPAPRVTHAAQGADLGRWERSDEVNRGQNSPGMWLICGIGAPVLGAQIVAALVVPGSSMMDSEGNHFWSWALVVTGIVIGVLALGAAALLISIAVGILRRGRLLLHRFESGYVLERTSRGVRAARYDDTSAEVLTFENAGGQNGDTSSRWDENLVILTLPDGARCSVCSGRDETDAALELALRCDATAPRRVPLSEAVELQENYRWDGR